MDVQVVEKNSQAVYNSFPSDNSSFSIIPGDMLSRLLGFRKKSTSGSVGLIAAYAALIYRYLNEEQYAIKLHLRKQSEETGSQELVVNIDVNTSAATLIDQVIQCLQKSPQWESELFSSPEFKPFFCSFDSEDNSIPPMSSYFECTEGNSAVVNIVESSDQCTTVQWHEHLYVLIKNISEDPNLSISKVTILSESELQTLHRWSVSIVDKDISRPQCLHYLFENTVSRYSKSPALRCKGKEITYEEFNQTSNSLARYLRSRHIGRGKRVAILLPRCETVFIAIMGILKAGAAYVPIDPRSPQDRIKYIIDDAQISLLITDNMLKQQNRLDCDIICTDDFPKLLKDFSKANITQKETGCQPSDPAYIIYTSGTTGKPKGVELLHQTVSNLIGAESMLFKVNHSDRVYQGFSVSFDASVEEMWLAWFSGALLVAATKSEALSGPDLVKFLAAEKVTVFSTVPTQISMMQEPVASVRILILGGEECHLKAIEPWLDGKRQVFNTYGPTEATVIATCGVCKKGVKPSIGKPAPNYAVFILDRNLQPVPVGITGELCIGGHCLASGYVNREDLTSQKFVKPPFTVGNGFPDRLYRSGDRARFAADGTIQFAGRIDDQVKLRGQRIELGEIENAIIKSSQARQVAVTLCTNSQGIQSLIAYLAADTKKGIDEKKLKDSLKSFLPSYMIPGQFCLLEELPVLPSGKIDRKRLPALSAIEHNDKKEIIAPRTEVEKQVLTIWQKYFDRQDISINDDFFDLGGHSLLAATIISELRNLPNSQNLPLQYIYQYKTVETLAKVIQEQQEAFTVKEGPAVTQTTDNKGKSRTLATIVCGLFQALALYPIFMLFSTPLIIPFIIDWFNPDVELLAWVTASFFSMLLLFPAVIVMSITGKWLIIGKFKPGQYKLWSFYYFRFWFVSRLMDLVPTRILRGSPFLVTYYRLLGAKIGRNVYLGTDRLRVCDMVTIGNNSSINADAHLMAYKVSNGMLHVGPIQIGNNCTVGTRSILSEVSTMQDFSELGELSLLPSGTTIPKGEYWEGSPASKVSNTVKSQKGFSQDYAASLRPTYLYKFCFTIAMMTVMILPTALLIPWTIIAFVLYVSYGPLVTLPFTIPMAALYTVSFCISVAIINKVIAPSNLSTSYPIYSFGYIRKWFVDTLVQLSLMAIQPLYATVYLPSWLRMLGAKIGKRAEISTVDHITAELLSIDEESFVADSASIGPAVVKNGTMNIGTTVVGKRSFIGNSALVPMGTNIGDNCLVGVLSRPPKDCAYKSINNTNWLGSPPIILPQRQKSQQFESHLTFNPPMYMVILRGLIEFFKITMPPALTSCCFILSYWFMSEILGPVATLSSYILLCPLVIFLCSFSVTLITVLLKWILVGRYRQIQKPLWSVFIWKNEFINSLCENLAFPLLLQMIQGTPLLPLFFRLLGCKIGKNVYMETTEITEFDLVEIKDNASLNYGCTIQTHLFEDRVMKMSSLLIGENATVGPMSVVLYDSSMKSGAVLDGLSLLMKGETLPSSTSWFGIPARSQANIAS